MLLVSYTKDAEKKEENKKKKEKMERGKRGNQEILREVERKANACKEIGECIARMQRRRKKRKKIWKEEKEEIWKSGKRIYLWKSRNPARSGKKKAKSRNRNTRRGNN